MNLRAYPLPLLLLLLGLMRSVGADANAQPLERWQRTEKLLTEPRYPGKKIWHRTGYLVNREHLSSAVERAQFCMCFPGAPMVWREVGADDRPDSDEVGVMSPSHLYLRWQLKDGRKFRVDEVDIDALILENVGSHPFISKEWSVYSSDGDDPIHPSLAYEIHEDSLIFRWIVYKKEKRVGRSDATKLALEIIGKSRPIATLKARMLKRINFNQRIDFQPSEDDSGLKPDADGYLWRRAPE